ncbi:LysR substrate-binding domain-containing protein [Ferruginivarius sediminum]|uniref:LysR family transcriptional regulator n=1 Tax=Ferruginivarius sediminum TaxID=2661937 RepID=A0A369TA24_9PROT|nr:LysR substrate-binding domain-containing protein [Ferruginivarius sediminum]RDD62179.1 LysR family transcriptional regulator [Ferruginivarius sediminum]
MTANLNIELLRAFVAVAECRHFTLAAERLMRTQSAVSMQVKRLESLVGTRLFERNKRVVRLTADGEAFRRYAQRLLRLNDEALAAFGRPSLQGRVRLGATDTTMCLLPPILSRFAEAYPLVELEIRCDRSWEALTALEHGELDLALVTQSCGHRGGEVLCREPLVWAAARDSAVDELDPLPLALFGPGCIYRDAALKALTAAGRGWRHAYNSSSRDGLDVAVSAGLAVTATPLSALPSGWRTLGPERGFPPLPEMDVLLYRAADEASGPVATFVRVIVETLRERPAQRPYSATFALAGE